MISIDNERTPADLLSKIDHFWDVSGEKIRAIGSTWNPADGSPVFTVNGRYTTKGWTEWTQGFQFGAAILQYDATGDPSFLEMGRDDTAKYMAPHVSHMGVHDHGFNNVSTYGNLLRLMNEGRISENAWERRFYELALKISGAVQARRWTPIRDGGYIYSFNGPHSLFVDTIRSLRALAVAHKLGHVLMEENDARVSLLERLILHAKATLTYNVYYGEGRDAYDVRGRTVHESIFNTNDGNYRCPPRNRAIPPFPPGPAGWPGRCSDAPNSWSLWRLSTTRIWPTLAAGPTSKTSSLKGPSPRPTSTSGIPPSTASPIGTPAPPA